MKTPHAIPCGLVAAARLVAGCVDLPDLGASAAAASKPSVAVRVEPPPEGDEPALAPVVQFHLSSPDTSLSPGDAVVVRGSLTERDLETLRAGQASSALQRKILPSSSWAAGGGGLVIAPLAALESGESHSVGIPSLGWSTSWTVLAEDSLARLNRLWPVEANAPFAGFAVWCERSPGSGWPPVDGTPLALGPELAPGTLRPGALDGFGPGCVHWEAEAGVSPKEIVPPPIVVLDDGRLARIEPERIGVDAPAGPEPIEVSCAKELQPVGPGCALVQDDRVLVFGTATRAVVGIEIAGLRRAGVPLEGDPLIFRGLVPDSPQLGHISFVDVLGRRFDDSIALHTADLEPHVVINEVMANPAGVEPGQEWVELYNDGRDKVELAGWVLEDVGLAVELPPFDLEPGTYVLVVNEGFVADGWADRAPAPGTPLLRVPHLGKSGLSNAGEALRLIGRDGVVRSMVPAIPSPQQSASIARVAPEAFDASPQAFELCEDGGTPGLPNAQSN